MLGSASTLSRVRRKQGNPLQTQNTEHTLHSSSFPCPQGRGSPATSVSVHCRASGAAATAQLSIILMGPQASHFHQCSKTGEKEISPIASFLKI